MHGVPASRVGAASIHDVKAASFGYQDVEHIDRLFQLDRKAAAGVKLSDSLDQAHRKIHVDTTVTLLVGIGQRTLGDVALYAQVVELGLVSTQTGFDVAWILAVSQLRESDALKLIEMRELERWTST